MKLYSILFGILLALAAISTAQSQVSMEFGVRIGPPPPRYEYQCDAPPPYAHAVWMRGHWMWDDYGDEYVWMPGRWVKARPSHIWVDGSWHRGPRGWGWREGYWRRAEYEDHDDRYYNRDDKHYDKHHGDWSPGFGRGRALGHYKNGKR